MLLYPLSACHWCKKDLVNLKVRKDQEREQGVYRCLVCDGCGNSESKNRVRRFINRDINGALNILECLIEWIYNKRRPAGLKRGESDMRSDSSQNLDSTDHG